MTNIHEYLFIQMWIISPLMWVSISVIYHHLNNLYKYYVSSHFQKQNFFPSLKFKGREQKSAGVSFFQILSLKATVSVGHNNLRLSVLFSPWKGKKKYLLTTETNVQSHLCQIYNSQPCQVSKEMKLQHLRIADLQKIYQKSIQSMSKMPTSRKWCILFVNC